jgi:hypothetical protein
MAHCGYEPVWDVVGLNIRLRFRYLEDPLKGRFVGEDIEPGGFIETFYAPSFGGSASRERIMRKVVSAGLRGWYAEPMAEFGRSLARAVEMELREPN